MESISISPRFFTHELNNYSNWRQAFWRELIQNSVDENCSRIEISLTQENGACNITFSDNGPGMSEATMRGVYFQLGATGKEGSDTIGGHGRARILTCFAHRSYAIRTQNLLCTGQGGHYTINNQLSHFKGCKIEIEITIAAAGDMEEALIHYLETCQLPCHIFINTTPFTNWLHRRKATRALSFGTIHTTRSFSHKTICRVRGVTMFERYSGCPSGTILEIEAAKSRDVLTVSRDNLKYEQQGELDAFLSEITLDHESIKRDCSLNRTEIFGPFKKIGKRLAKETKELLQAAKAGCLGSSHTTYHGMTPAAYTGPAWEGPAPENISQEILEETNTPEIPYSVHYEDAPTSILSSAKRFHPDHISGRRLKLLIAWDTTLEFVLEALEEWKAETILYLPGFAFGPFDALHKKEETQEGEGHILYLNPIDRKGRIRLSAHHIPELYATAIHECSHIFEHYHDEHFASIQTQLTTLTAGKFPKLKSRIRTALAHHSTQNP